MDTVANLGSLVLPFIIFTIYILGANYLVNLIVYVSRLPKQLEVLEQRIKQLEEKEKNNGEESFL